MANNFRSSRFRPNRDMGEDVNPSAYIVNLADCMLVLACGFLVAMISFWQIDIGPALEELDSEQLEQVEPEEMPADVTEGGSYYVEAGVVYQDPHTGQYYIVTQTEGEGISSQSDGLSSQSELTSSRENSSSQSLTDDEIRRQRALGGD